MVNTALRVLVKGNSLQATARIVEGTGQVGQIPAPVKQYEKLLKFSPEIIFKVSP